MTCVPCRDLCLEDRDPTYYSLFPSVETKDSASSATARVVTASTPPDVPVPGGADWGDLFRPACLVSSPS